MAYVYVQRMDVSLGKESCELCKQKINSCPLVTLDFSQIKGVK